MVLISLLSPLVNTFQRQFLFNKPTQNTLIDVGSQSNIDQQWDNSGDVTMEFVVPNQVI